MFLAVTAIVNFLVEQILGGRDEVKRKRRLKSWWKKGPGNKGGWSQCSWMGQVRNMALEGPVCFSGKSEDPTGSFLLYNLCPTI